MRKKRTKDMEESVKKLKAKIYSYSEDIQDEFDIMELIEDNIREVFECDLECTTCTREEQGECMQSWKKANLYFLRKLYLDETKLVEFTENIKEMINLVVETKKILEDDKKNQEDETKGKYKSRFEEIRERNRVKPSKGYSDYFS